MIKAKDIRVGQTAELNGEIVTVVDKTMMGGKVLILTSMGTTVKLNPNEKVDARG